MKPAPWLTEPEAVRHLRLEHLKRPFERLQRLCRQGRIKFVKRGAREYLFRQEWLESYLTRQN